MNKYSTRIIDFLSGTFSTYLNTYNILPKHELIAKIENIYKDIDVKQSFSLKLKTTAEYTKLHHLDDDSLIFIVFKELFNDKLCTNINIKSKDLENIGVFNSWYRLNHNKVNLYEILSTLKTKSKYKKIYDVMFVPVKNRKDLHQLLYRNSFIALDVIQHAESSNILYKRYVNSHIDVSLYVPLQENSKIKYEEPDVELINKIFLFMSKLFGKPDEKLKLVVFYGDQKKLINFNDTIRILCSDNVNSGLSVKHELIMIWRKEEFYKVFIHELVHFFGIDFYVLDSIYKKLDMIFKSKYKVIGSDKINESYTEALAIFLHSIIYSIENKMSLDDIMKHEIMFSHFQMAKILCYFGCESFNQLTNTNIKQNTSVFSYYIIKSILMVNYSLLFNFWLQNGFKILNGNENGYEQLYTQIINKNGIDKDSLNFLINYVRNNVDKFEGTFIFRTMRMSCYTLA